MSVQVETNGLPLQFVARLFYSLKRRLGLIRASQVPNHGQTTPQPTMSRKRRRNRLRSRRKPPPPPTARPSNGHVKETHQRLRSLSNSFANTLSMRPTNGFSPSWRRSKPPAPVQPFSPHLPDDVLRTIFEVAAEEHLETACSLALVASHVRAWVDPILYSTVRLEGPESIRLFARTVHQSSYAGLGEMTHRPTRRIAKPPDFFGCVRSLTLLPQRERVLLFFRDTVRDATLILTACHGVTELESSGDFLRRTDVSEATTEPTITTNGDGDSSGGSTEPITVIAAPPTVAAVGSNERALMRPTHLTLVPPTLNVNFRLPILSNVTHLHYSSSLPSRNLNFLGVLLALTHFALDYQVGVATTRADTLLHLVRTALGWESPLPPGEELPSADDPGHPEPPESSSSGHTEDEAQPVATSYAPRLTMVVVRVILRPRVGESDRAGEAWRQLAHLAEAEPRLVYFETRGLFNGDVWNTPRERISTSWYRDSIS